MAERCIAKTKSRNGERCRLKAAHGTTVCEKHGANGIIASRGPGAVQYKHGRYARHGIPATLRERYDAAMEDPDLLSARRNVALLEAMLDESLESLDASGNTGLWADAREQFRRFTVAMTTGDDRTMGDALSRLDQAISRGQSDAEARKATREIIQEQDKVMASERKRLVETRQILTVEEALAFVRRVEQAVIRHVTDDATLRRIRQDVTSVVG